ncbi:tyrosine-protein phosphatase non-receptor type 23 isoform X3 [Biomphalaria glabrata]|nr:tyrosine-protein phosphatase non-receptor type 23 isoform X3 [Biomphalaria glabrata]
MEALPRLPMLSFDLKHSPEYVEFGPTLKQYIKNHYGEDPALYNKPCTDLEQLRQAAIQVSRDVMGCTTLKKYYAQLQYLQGRFPMGEGEEAAIAFTWEDIQTGRDQTLCDIKFEQACILYNIGSLHSLLGALDTGHNAEGMKVSCTHFQCAAWAFELLRNNFCSSSMSTDMSFELLNFHITLMLAQAQECILEKSIFDNRKNSITAKVAAKVVEFYKEACGLIDLADSKQQINSRMHKEWSRRLIMKNAFYQSITYFFLGREAEEAQKPGECLAYLTAAKDELTKATQLAKNEVPEVLDSLHFAKDVILGKYESAKKDNDFVYHAKVPAIESLPEIKGACLVKGIPFDPTDKEISGPDIFQKLVPMEAHEASSIYSEEKAKLSRSVMEEVDQKNMELDQFMSSLQCDVEQLIPKPNLMPENLMEKCAAMSVRANAIKELTDSMASVSGLATEVQLSLEEIQQLLNEDNEKTEQMEKQYGKKNPSAVLPRLQEELATYRQRHDEGNQLNATLHKAMNTHTNNLKMLVLHPSEINNLLPSAQPALSVEQEGIVSEIRRLLQKVNEMREQRKALVDQFREKIHNDDITNVLVTQDITDKASVFREQLKKHDQVVTYIRQNLSAQDNILRHLTDVNAKFALIRQAYIEASTKRDKAVQDLILSYEKYEELLAKSQKGVDYYKKLLENVSKTLERCRSECKVRHEEREMLLTKFAPKVPAPSRPLAPKPGSNTEAPSSSSTNPEPNLNPYLPDEDLSSLPSLDMHSSVAFQSLPHSFEGPKLKDFLPFMKPRSFGPKGGAPSPPVAPENPSLEYGGDQGYHGLDPSLASVLPATLAQYLASKSSGISTMAGGARHTPSPQSSGHGSPRHSSASVMQPGSYLPNSSLDTATLPPVPSLPQNMQGPNRYNPVDHGSMSEQFRQYSVSSVQPGSQVNAPLGISQQQQPSNPMNIVSSIRQPIVSPALSSFNQAQPHAAFSQPSDMEKYPLQMPPHQPMPPQSGYGQAQDVNKTQYQNFNAHLGYPGTSSQSGQKPFIDQGHTPLSHSNNPQGQSLPGQMAPNQGYAPQTSGVMGQNQVYFSQGPGHLMQPHGYIAQGSGQMAQNQGYVTQGPGQIAAGQGTMQPVSLQTPSQITAGSGQVSSIQAPTYQSHSSQSFGNMNYNVSSLGDKISSNSFQSYQNFQPGMQPQYLPTGQQTYQSGVAQQTNSPHQSPTKNADYSKQIPVVGPMQGLRPGEPCQPWLPSSQPSQYQTSTYQNQTSQPFSAVPQTAISAGNQFQNQFQGIQSLTQKGQGQTYYQAMNQPHQPYSSNIPTSQQVLAPTQPGQPISTQQSAGFQQPVHISQQAVAGTFQPLQQPLQAGGHGQMQQLTSQTQQFPQQLAFQPLQNPGQQHGPTPPPQQSSQSGQIAPMHQLPRQMAPMPQQSGQMAPMPQQSGQMAPLPQQPGQMTPIPQQPGQMPPMPQQLGQIAPMPQQPGHMAPMPHQPGHMAPMPQQPGKLASMPQQPGQITPMPQQLGQIAPISQSNQVPPQSRQLMTPPQSQPFSQQPQPTHIQTLPAHPFQQQPVALGHYGGQPVLQPQGFTSNISTVPAQPAVHQQMPPPLQPSSMSTAVRPSTPVQAITQPPAAVSHGPSTPTSPTTNRISVSRQSSSLDDILSSSPNGVKDTIITPQVLTDQERQLQKEEALKNQAVSQTTEPYSSQSSLKKLLEDVEAFGKFVDELSITILGVSRLDTLWKSLLDSQDAATKKQSMAIARCYPIKNRDPDIMPYDDTRVVLTSTKDDYINASWLNDLAPSCPKFITTQAPKTLTISEYWAMVYEQGSEVLVQITSEYETGKNFPVYYPVEKDKNMEQGVILLSLQSVKFRQNWVERILYLKNTQTKQGRTLVHLQFKNWPVSGFPDDVSSILSFISEVHSFYLQQRSLTKPIIVHCGLGIGRTGVFTLVYAAVQEILHGNGLVDLPGLAKRMLQKRRGILNKKEQLKCCYDAVLYFSEEYLEKRGMLVKNPHFKKQLPRQSPKHQSHQTPAADDIVLGTVDLQTIRENVGKLHVQTSEVNKREDVAAEPTNLSKRSSITSLPDVVLQYNEPSLGEKSCSSSYGSDLSSVGLQNMHIDIGAPPVAQHDQKSDSSKPPTAKHSISDQTLNGQKDPSSLPVSLAQLQDPATFTMGSPDAKKRNKITKANFNQSQGSLQSGQSDPGDPLGNLDPLWTLTKK